MNGPTIWRLGAGSARRTSNPPRSRARGIISVLSIHRIPIGQSGSSVGFQLMSLSPCGASNEVSFKIEPEPVGTNCCNRTGHVHNHTQKPKTLPKYSKLHLNAFCPAQRTNSYRSSVCFFHRSVGAGSGSLVKPQNSRPNRNPIPAVL